MSIGLLAKLAKSLERRAMKGGSSLAAAAAAAAARDDDDEKFGLPVAEKLADATEGTKAALFSLK